MKVLEKPTDSGDNNSSRDHREASMSRFTYTKGRSGESSTCTQTSL